MARPVLSHRWRNEFAKAGVSEATAEVCVLVVSKPGWDQRRVGKHLKISQQAVSKHLAVACRINPEWRPMLARPRGCRVRHLAAA